MTASHRHVDENQSGPDQHLPRAAPIISHPPDSGTDSAVRKVGTSNTGYFCQLDGTTEAITGYTAQTVFLKVVDDPNNTVTVKVSDLTAGGAGVIQVTPQNGKWESNLNAGLPVNIGQWSSLFAAVRYTPQAGGAVVYRPSSVNAEKVRFLAVGCTTCPVIAEPEPPVPADSRVGDHR